MQFTISYRLSYLRHTLFWAITAVRRFTVEASPGGKASRILIVHVFYASSIIGFTTPFAVYENKTTAAVDAAAIQETIDMLKAAESPDAAFDVLAQESSAKYRNAVSHVINNIISGISIDESDIILRSVRQGQGGDYEANQVTSTLHVPMNSTYLYLGTEVFLHFPSAVHQGAVIDFNLYTAKLITDDAFLLAELSAMLNHTFTNRATELSSNMSADPKGEAQVTEHGGGHSIRVSEDSTQNRRSTRSTQSQLLLPALTDDKAAGAITDISLHTLVSNLALELLIMHQQDDSLVEVQGSLVDGINGRYLTAATALDSPIETKVAMAMPSANVRPGVSSFKGYKNGPDHHEERRTHGDGTSVPADFSHRLLVQKSAFSMSKVNAVSPPPAGLVFPTGTQLGGLTVTGSTSLPTSQVPFTASSTALTAILALMTSIEAEVSFTWLGGKIVSLCSYSCCMPWKCGHDPHVTGISERVFSSLLISCLIIAQLNLRMNRMDSTMYTRG